MRCDYWRFFTVFWCLRIHFLCFADSREWKTLPIHDARSQKTSHQSLVFVWISPWSTVNTIQTNLNHPSPLLLINLHFTWHLTNLVLWGETSGLQLLKIPSHRWNNNRNSLAGPWNIGQVFAVIVLLNCSSWNHLSLESGLLKDKNENMNYETYVAWISMAMIYEPRHEAVTSLLIFFCNLTATTVAKSLFNYILSRRCYLDPLRY